MTITLTVGELEAFASACEEWSNKRMVHVVQKVLDWKRIDVMERGSPKGFTENIMEQFTKENPRPDWRSFLK